MISWRDPLFSRSVPAGLSEGLASNRPAGKGVVKLGNGELHHVKGLEIQDDIQELLLCIIGKCAGVCIVKGEIRKASQQLFLVFFAHGDLNGLFTIHLEDLVPQSHVCHFFLLLIGKKYVDQTIRHGWTSFQWCAL